MPVVREMLITYGAQAIPGVVAGAAVTLHKIHRIRKGPERFEVEFEILVNGLGSSVTLAAACLALEDTFNTRRLALTVDLNGNNALTLDDTDRSGLDVTPSIEKVGDEDPPDRFDTNTSRLYRVRIEGGLESLGTLNRLRFGFDVDFTGSRRTVLTITGTYTAASGGLAASGNYLALIDARVALITAALAPSVFEKTKERYSPDDVDGFTTFERIYKEILFNQSVGVVDNPAIVDPNLQITRGDESDEGTGEGNPLATLTAQFDTEVDHDINTDLVQVWETIALPLIAQQMGVVAGTGVAITRIEPRFDFYRHTISATVIGQAVGAGSLLSKKIKTINDVDYGKIVREVWPTSDEVPDDEEAENPTPGRAHVYQAARVIIRTIETKTVEVTGEAANPVGANRNFRVGAREGVEVGGESPSVEATFESIRMTRVTSSERKDRGITTAGILIPVLERTVVETFRIIVAIGAGGGTGVGGFGIDVAGSVGLGLDPNLGGSGGR